MIRASLPKLVTGGSNEDERDALANRPTRGDVAARFGRSRGWVENLERKGVFHPTKDDNGIVRFDPTEIARYASKLRRRSLRYASPDPGEISRLLFDRFAAEERNGTLHTIETKRAIVREFVISPARFRAELREFEEFDPTVGDGASSTRLAPVPSATPIAEFHTRTEREIAAAERARLAERKGPKP